MGATEPKEAGQTPPNPREFTEVPRQPAELWLRASCVLGEGPVWNEGRLYWLDIAQKRVHAKPLGTGEGEYHVLGAEPGCLVPWQGSRFAIATELGFGAFEARTGHLEYWVDPEAGLAANRFNDGKCDPRGRFFAGTLNRNKEPLAALYALEHDRTAREVLRPMTCSNGMAWSARGTEFYHIDTPTRTVREFCYDVSTGRLTDGRPVIIIPEGHGYPDGMTVDTNGNLWIALWDGWAVECWDPRTGARLARIDVPAARVTSCTFGGKDHRTLFITTARHGLSATALDAQSLAGSIFCASPGVAGLPAVPYGGA